MERSHRPAHISPIVRAPQPIISISDDASRVSARLPTGESVDVLLHGATVISWKNVDGSENLWLSDSAVLDGKKPVRGGIPVVFPVFGPPPKSGHPTTPLPQHGFARNVRWEYLGKSTDESASASDANVKLDFGLYSSALPEALRKAWPYDFGLMYSVTLSPDGLRTTVNVINEGGLSFQFQLLLHTYLRVKDVTTVKVTGLLGVKYADKVLDMTEHTQSQAAVAIEGEIDRVYKDIPQDTSTVVEGDKPLFDVTRDKMKDTVVWNPWKEKAAAMGDFTPKDGYTQMLCVEVGAVNGWTVLDAGESWEGGQFIKRYS